MPVAGIVDYVVGNPNFDTIWVRLSVPLLCLPLIACHKLPPVLAARFYLYFVFLVTYTFPFAFGLMLVQNAALSPPGEEIHIIWILQYFIALFLFIQLAVSGLLATSLWTISSALALFPIVLQSEPNTDELQRVLLYPITAYLTAIAFGVVTNRNQDIIADEKLKAVSAIGANLAHELRTPLASIRAVAQGADNLLPVLTDSYRKAKASGIPVAPLRESQVANLSKALDTIKNEVAYSNTIIDMLLVNTADKPLAGVNRDRFGCKECIEEAVSRYPFNNQHERELIRIDVESDFEIIAPRLLIVHVLFNLIKNALYYVQQAGKGDILISARRLPDGGRIVVHDDGMGIPPQIRQHIFERFYTTTRTGQGAGIGLSFCKMVMDAIGGTIQCDSVEGKYTTFTLGFPPVTR